MYTCKAVGSGHTHTQTYTRVTRQGRMALTDVNAQHNLIS